MDQDNKVSSGLAELVAAIRISQTASDMLDEAFAALLKVNRTDARCLDLVQRMGRVTAGELADLAGLTTGAVTTVIDRLEAAGYMRRLRDAKDRRKVHVELTDHAQNLGRMIYDQMSVLGQLRDEFSAPDMALIARFLAGSAGLNRKMAQMLRAEQQKGGTAQEQAQRFAALMQAESAALPEPIAKAGAGI